MFAGNFAPTGWALCAGQLMPISQNTALFSLLGTFYGGDGKSTFALPNLQDNAPVHQGQGNGLSERFLGEMSGSEFVTLLESEMPAHSHIVNVINGNGDEEAPAPDRILARSAVQRVYNTAGPAGNSMSPLSVGVTGGSLPHNNMQPYLTLTFIIALQGIFPPRG
jgi:microcystin-dependent protein